MSHSSYARYRSRWIPAFAGMTVLGIALFLFSVAHASNLPDNIQLTTPPQHVAPLVFEDANGMQHALSDYCGRVVVLNVWASWCPSCVQEMASLDTLQSAFDPQRVIVVPLSEDHSDAVGAFYHTHKIAHLPMAIDTAGRAPQAFHLRGLPTTLVIDPRGFEIARIEGSADGSLSQLIDFIGQQISYR
jgi:thiol-disulfide isomerase/thioredoxin